jgi:hypothetical protein
MSVQKSDAMLQHEKWIKWVVEHNPKWRPGMDKPVNIIPETPKLVMIFAAIVVIMAAVISMFQ